MPTDTVDMVVRITLADGSFDESVTLTLIEEPHYTARMGAAAMLSTVLTLFRSANADRTRASPEGRSP